MIAYHITDKIYQVGDIVSVNDFTGVSRYYQRLPNNQKKVNEYLSSNRPEGEPSRISCLYTFEEPEYCVYFKKNELKNGEVLHLYKCEMNSEQGHPMILVNHFLKVTEDKWDQLREEYWHPTKKWHLLEHVSEEIRIIEEISISATPSLINNALLEYSEDATTARNIKFKKIMDINKFDECLSLVALPFSSRFKTIYSSKDSLVKISNGILIEGLCANDFKVTINEDKTGKDSLNVIISIPNVNGSLIYSIVEDVDNVINRLPSCGKYEDNVKLVIRSLYLAYRIAFCGESVEFSPFEKGVCDPDINNAAYAYNHTNIPEIDRLKICFASLKKVKSKYQNDRYFMGFFNHICGSLHKYGVDYYDL